MILAWLIAIACGACSIQMFITDNWIGGLVLAGVAVFLLIANHLSITSGQQKGRG